VFDVLDAALTKARGSSAKHSRPRISVLDRADFRGAAVQDAAFAPSFDRYIDRCAARPAFQRASVIAAG